MPVNIKRWMTKRKDYSSWNNYYFIIYEYHSYVASEKYYVFENREGSPLIFSTHFIM